MINELKTKRFRMLNALYEFMEGNTQKWCNLKELCMAQGISFDSNTFEWLHQEGLINLYGAAYTCFLAHDGVKAIEEAWQNPHKDSYYFPAIANMTPQNG